MSKSVYGQTYKYLCNLLIQAREEANLTQSALAKILNKPQSYVSKYERGERRLDIVEFLDIANALKIDALIVFAKLKDIHSSQ